MNDPALPVLNTQPVETAADQAFEALYKAVISLELKPGERVSENDVAKRMGVSRQPVRDAFFRLSKLGFLLIRPQRATTVTKISIPAVQEAAFIRAALETACLREATVKATDADIESLGENLADQQAAVAAGDSAGFHELDEVFHLRLCEIAGHGYAWTLIREQKAHMDRVRYLTLPGNLEAAYQEHCAIIEAMRSRDVDATVASLQDHLGRLSGLVEQVRAENREFFEAD